MTQPDVADELEAAIAEVYRGPLDQFVGRRDALVKQLRASRQRENAERVKALRKPGRVAWVLDVIAHEEPAAIQQLEEAIGRAQKGDDVRTAFTNVKAAVSNIAAIGARVAVRAEQPIEPTVIAAAIHAVIGHGDAFAEWRRGRLVDVPVAGGLDMLAAITPREPSAPRQPPSPARPARVETAEEDKGTEAAEQHARDEAARRKREALNAAHSDLRRAEGVLSRVNDDAARAAQSLVKVERSLEAAARALLHAQKEVQDRRTDLDAARAISNSAVNEQEVAQRAVDAARSRIATLSE